MPRTTARRPSAANAIEPGVPSSRSCTIVRGPSGNPGRQGPIPLPPPPRTGFRSQARPGSARPASATVSVSGTRMPRAHSAAASANGSRTRASTAGSLPSRRRPAARRRTAAGWFSRFATYAAAPGNPRASATAAAAWYSRPTSRISATFSTIAFWSRSPKASTVRQRYPARTADSANARVETPTITTASASELGRQIVDRFGVEDQVVALEQPRDAGLVQLHLEAADAERAEGEGAVALCAVVGGLHTLDPERRHRVHVRDHPQPGAPRPCRARHELRARGPRGQHELGALQRGGRLGRAGHRQDVHRLAEPLADARRRRLAASRIARRDHDLRAQAGQEPRRPRADRPGAGEHHRPPAPDVSAGGPHHLEDRRRRRGVRAVGIEQDREAERAEERLLDLREQAFGTDDVAAADEDRRVVEVLRTAREDGAVDQRARLAFLHVAVAQHRVRTRVVAHDAVE